MSGQDSRMPWGQNSPRRRGLQRRTRPFFSRRTWTGPKEGAVSVVKTLGWLATVSGMPLPPLSPVRITW
jgi:hypothetical protein